MVYLLFFSCFRVSQCELFSFGMKVTDFFSSGAKHLYKGMENQCPFGIPVIKLWSWSATFLTLHFYHPYITT